MVSLGVAKGVASLTAYVLLLKLAQVSHLRGGEACCSEKRSAFHGYLLKMVPALSARGLVSAYVD